LSTTNTKNTFSFNRTHKKEALNTTWDNSNLASSAEHELNQEQQKSNIASTIASSLGLSVNPAAASTAIPNTHLPETQTVNLANHDKKLALADSHAISHADHNINAPAFNANAAAAHAAHSLNQHLPSMANASTLSTAAVAESAISLAASSAAAPAYTTVTNSAQIQTASAAAAPTYTGGGVNGVTSSRSIVTYFDPIADIRGCK
jgi:hypothetical protein